MFGYWVVPTKNGNAFTGAINSLKRLNQIAIGAYKFAFILLTNEEMYDGENLFGGECGLNYDHPTIQEFLEFTDKL